MAAVDVIVVTDPLWEQLLVSFAGTTGALVVAWLVYKWTRRDESIRLAAEMSNARQLAFEQSQEAREVERRAQARDERVRRTAGLSDLLVEISTLGLTIYAIGTRNFPPDPEELQKLKTGTEDLHRYGTAVMEIADGFTTPEQSLGFALYDFAGALYLLRLSAPHVERIQADGGLKREYVFLTMRLYVEGQKLIAALAQWVAGELPPNWNPKPADEAANRYDKLRALVSFGESGRNPPDPS